MNTDDRLFADWSSDSRSRSSHSMNPHTNFNQSSMYQWNMTSPHSQTNMPGTNPMSSRMLNSGLHQGLGLPYNTIMPYSNTYNTSNTAMHPSMNLPSGTAQNQFGMGESMSRSRDVMQGFSSMSSTHSPYLTQNDSTGMQDFTAYRYNSASDPLNTNRLMHSDFISSERRNLSRASSNTSALDASAQMSFPLDQTQMSSGSRSHLSSADSSFMTRSNQPFELQRADTMGFARSDYSSHMSSSARSFGGLAHTSSRQAEIPMSYASAVTRASASVNATAMEKSIAANQSFWSSQPQPTNTSSLSSSEALTSQREKTPYFPVTQSLPGSAPVPRGSYNANTASYPTSRPSAQGSNSNVASPQSTYAQSMAATTVTTASTYTTSTPSRSQSTAYSHMSPATTSAPSTPLATVPPTTTAASSVLTSTNKVQSEQDSTSMPGSNQSYGMAPCTPAPTTPSFTQGYSPPFTTTTVATTTMSPYPAPQSNDSVTSGNYRAPGSAQSNTSNHSAAVQQKAQINSSPLQDTQVSDGLKAEITMQTDILKTQTTPEKMSPDDGGSGQPVLTEIVQTIESAIGRLPHASPRQTGDIDQALRQLKHLINIGNITEESLTQTLSMSQGQRSSDKMEAQSSSENSEDEQKEEMLFKEGVRRPLDLPRELTLKIDEQLQISVWTKQDITNDTEFGPYQGKLTMKFMPAESRDKWLVTGPNYDSVAMFQPLDDLEAELPPNWLRYISPASSDQDQNCVLTRTEEDTRYMIKIVGDIAPNQELFAVHNEEFLEEEDEIQTQTFLDIPEPITREDRRQSDSSMPELEAQEDREIPDMIPEDYDNEDEFCRKRELSDVEELEEESPRKSKRRKLLAAEPDIPADIGMIDPDDLITDVPVEEVPKAPKRRSRKKKKEVEKEREESVSANESGTPSPAKTDRKRRSRRDKSKEDKEIKEDSDHDESPLPSPSHKGKKKDRRRQQKSESPDKRDGGRRKRRDASLESSHASDKESDMEASDDERGSADKKDDIDRRTKRKWTHREFKCEVCGETIRYVTKFDRHMMDKHAIMEPWKCERCPTERRFRLYATLEKHMITTHPGEKLSFESGEASVSSIEKTPEIPEKPKRTRKSRKSKSLDSGEKEDAIPLKEEDVIEEINDIIDDDDDMGKIPCPPALPELLPPLPSHDDLVHTKFELEVAELHKVVKKMKTKKESHESGSEKKKSTGKGDEPKKTKRKSKKNKSKVSMESPEGGTELDLEKKPEIILPNEIGGGDSIVKRTDLKVSEAAEELTGSKVYRFSDDETSPLPTLRCSEKEDVIDASQTSNENNSEIRKFENNEKPLVADDDSDVEKTEKNNSDSSIKKKRKHRKLTFSCDECNETFKWTTKYMKHMSEMHGVTKPFKCEKCEDVSFGTYQNYERHCLSKHDPNNSSTSSNRSNRRSWTKNQFKCDVCGEEVVHATKFDKHMFEKHGIMKPWKCSQCDQSFRLLSSLRNHTSYVHEQVARPKTGKNRDAKSIMKTDSNADMAQAFDIGILEAEGNASTPKKDVLQESVPVTVEDETTNNDVHSGGESKESNEIETTSEKKKKRKDGYKKPGTKKYTIRQFTCHLCQESVSNVSGFEKHMLEQHQVDNCWQCKLCITAPFRLFNGLQQHMRIMHSDVDQEAKPALCELCGHSFKTDENLRRHMRIHLETLPFPCMLCGQAFNGGVLLQRHMDKEHVSHPDIHKCDVCLKVHTTQEQLDDHKANHDCTSEINIPFGEIKTDDGIIYFREGRERVQCKTCDKWLLKQDFEEHENIHTGSKPHECNECGKGFAQKAGLGVHMKKSHSDEKNYKCDICTKAFKLKSYLRQHMVTHSAEKPHECSVCGKRFTRKAFMKKHEKRHIDSKDGSKDDVKDEVEEGEMKKSDDEKDDKSEDGKEESDVDTKKEEEDL
ncbi:uncharacterized protein LOC102809079 [Saccoglossus kowalevskii]|uniref:Microtubule-associated protein futsch-like n=1 Tax=Saccoglossus kowalevskii TaxID=10224 RepID=A0ABM0MW85_SACKO|nr:PREDICTED: microtubule-associated protein futsch-like [Saccoglossus kowalevskii]